MKEVDRNGGVVKQLQVMADFESNGDKDEVGTLNATLVQLIVVPAAGKENVGVMGTPFKTTSNTWVRMGAYPFHPFLLHGPRDDVSGCRLQVVIKQRAPLMVLSLWPRVA